MAHDLEQFGAGPTHAHTADHHGPRALPTVLTAPDVVLVWRTRALIVAAVSGVLSLAFLATHEGRNHMLRAYLMGTLTSFQLRRVARWSHA